jgi:hypothetical protein
MAAVFSIRIIAWPCQTAIPVLAVSVCDGRGVHDRHATPQDGVAAPEVDLATIRRKVENNADPSTTATFHVKNQ